MQIELVNGPIEADKQYIRIVGGKNRPLVSYGPRKLEDSTPGAVSSVLAVIDPNDAEFWGIYTHDEEGFANHFSDVPSKELAESISKALAEVVDKQFK